MSAEFTTVTTVLAGLSTFVLAIFAAVQLWQIRQGARDRRRSAYQSLYAEFVRIDSIADAWQKEDLVILADGMGIAPEDIYVRDWGALLKLLGQVDSGTATLATFALDMVEEAGKRVRFLLGAVADGAGEDVTRVLEKQVKSGLKDASLIFQDALQNAPAWIRSHPVVLRDPSSSLGLKMQEYFIKATGRKPRFGRLGRRLAAWLAAVARWLDPRV